MNVLPSAVCIIRPEHHQDFVHALKLSSNKDGVLSFFVRPKIESEVPEKTVVDCEAGGKTVRFPLELRVSSKPTIDMPAPIHEDSETTSPRKVLPALSEKEMLHLSNEDLIMRGYPFGPIGEHFPILRNGKE